MIFVFRDLNGGVKFIKDIKNDYIFNKLEGNQMRIFWEIKGEVSKV